MQIFEKIGRAPIIEYVEPLGKRGKPAAGLAQGRLQVPFGPTGQIVQGAKRFGSGEVLTSTPQDAGTVVSCVRKRLRQGRLPNTSLAGQRRETAPFTGGLRQQSL